MWGSLRSVLCYLSVKGDLAKWSIWELRAESETSGKQDFYDLLGYDLFRSAVEQSSIVGHCTNSAHTFQQLITELGHYFALSKSENKFIGHHSIFIYICSTIFHLSIFLFLSISYIHSIQLCIFLFIWSLYHSLQCLHFATTFNSTLHCTPLCTTTLHS